MKRCATHERYRALIDFLFRLFSVVISISVDSFTNTKYKLIALWSYSYTRWTWWWCVSDKHCRISVLSVNWLWSVRHANHFYLIAQGNWFSFFPHCSWLFEFQMCYAIMLNNNCSCNCALMDGIDVDRETNIIQRCTSGFFGTMKFIYFFHSFCESPGNTSVPLFSSQMHPRSLCTWWTDF